MTQWRMEDVEKGLAVIAAARRVTEIRRESRIPKERSPEEAREMVQDLITRMAALDEAVEKFERSIN